MHSAPGAAAGSDGAHDAASLNVAAFLRAASALGVAPDALFSAADLEAEEPRPAVVMCLAALQAATSGAGAPSEARPATPPPLRRLLSGGSGGNWLTDTPVGAGPREASLFSLGVSLLRDSPGSPAEAPGSAERPLLAGLPEHMLTPVLEGALAEITREYERRLMRKELELRKARDAAAEPDEGPSIYEILAARRKAGAEPAGQGVVG